MKQGVPKAWTKQSLMDAYRENADGDLARRITQVMNHVDGLGRLLIGRTINPAFGVAGNSGRRVLAVWERDDSRIMGRIAIFASPERYASPEEYAVLYNRLLPITMPAARQKPFAWDIAYLSTLSEDAFLQFVRVLEEMGPAPASDARVDLPARADTVVSRIVRDSATVRRLKRLYDNRCQLCGERVGGLHGWTYSEAHHVRPLGEPHNGPDAEDNLLVLCPNHHAACDFGAIELKPASLRFAPGHAVRAEHIRYHNEKIVRRPG